MPNEDGGRAPGPMLLAKLLFEVLREVEYAVREETDDAKDVFRVPLRDAPAPTKDVPFTVGRVPAGAGADLAGSPARSTRVFLFGSTSFTRRIEAKDQSNTLLFQLPGTHKRGRCILKSSEAEE